MVKHKMEEVEGQNETPNKSSKTRLILLQLYGLHLKCTTV